MEKERKPQGIIALVDVALFSLVDNELCVLLHRREREPFAGALALPGGYVRPGEDDSTIEAARRVLATKAGVKAPFLEQLATYSGPSRDPGGWSMSVAYFALVNRTELTVEGERGLWTPVSKTSRLAFDHSQMVADAVDRIRKRSAYSILPAFLAGDQFTLSGLQKIYETILGEPINAVSFRRRIEEMDAIEPIKGVKAYTGASRPAQVFRIRKSIKAHLYRATLDRGFATR
jgi:8-oxo-dGTP diphosphatase